jgi:ankyrin repeat protein
MKNTNQLLEEAITSQDINLIKHLLNKSTFDPWDDAIILNAIEKHQMNIIELLVGFGFDLNHDCYSGGCYPLEIAIEVGYSPEEIIYLLSLGANPDICSCSGTPLMSAVYRKDENIIDILIDLKVDLNRQVEGGFTALMAAVGTGCILTTKKLVEHGADPNILTTNDFPQTALVYAAELNYKSIFEYLLPLTESEEQKNIAIKYLNEEVYPNG